jgi:glycosyltransferase involved in cell wall biosynthesis
VEFGSAQKVDLVWAVLQGQTLTQIAPDVARRLGAPLVTQVWDPLHWWLQANRIDPINRRAALADFDRALRASRTCIAASWAMAEDYEARYGTRSVPVISSYPKEWANSPDLCQFPRDEIEIGMAGQFYAGEEWLQLLRALNMSGWQVRGKSVTVTVMGASAPPGEAPPGRIRFLGWRDQKDAAELLSKLDVLYCAYPFAPGMAEVAKLSFPSKVVLYLAAGRPILFHGPALASPAVYLRDRAASLIVPDLHAAAVYNGLCRLVDNPELYVELGRNAQKAFLRDFELGSMRASFESALGVTIDRDVEQAPSDGSQMRHSGTGGVAKRTGRAALA